MSAHSTQRSVDVELAHAAWSARDRAVLVGRTATAVGCAVLTDKDVRVTGCNIQHRFRSHDVHAEVNALSSVISMGAGRAVRIVIAAERDRFTPCGSCVDWLMELGGPECVVSFSPRPGELQDALTVHDLMPHYPS